MGETGRGGRRQTNILYIFAKYKAGEKLEKLFVCHQTKIYRLVDIVSTLLGRFFTLVFLLFNYFSISASKKCYSEFGIRPF